MDKPHKKLDAWRTSIDMADKIYRLTSGFPVDEKFGLVAQMRRAAVSVPSNIAEGAARTSSAEFRHFVSIARGSLSELDTQLDICVRLNFSDAESREAFDPLLNRIDRLLYGLHKSLRN